MDPPTAQNEILSPSLLKFGTRQSINDSRRLMYVPTSNYRQMRAQSVVGRSVIIDERGEYPPLLRKWDATCCLLLRRRVRVPFGSPSLPAHPHLAANRLILLPLGLLPMRHFTTLVIHSRRRRSADNSCIRSRPLTDGSLPPSSLPSFFPCFSLFNPPLATKIITKND